MTPDPSPFHDDAMLADDAFDALDALDAMNAASDASDSSAASDDDGDGAGTDSGSSEKKKPAKKKAAKKKATKKKVSKKKAAKKKTTTKKKATASADDDADDKKPAAKKKTAKKKATKKKAGKKKAAKKKSTKKKATTKKTETKKKATGKKAGKKKVRKYEPVNAKDKNLVIVESPAKAKTINKFLGTDFVVASSIGHIRDLTKKKPKGDDGKARKFSVGGIDVDNKFSQTYEVMEEKENVVKELKKAAKQAKAVYLAPDPDREGEAIAWHLAQELKVPEDKLYRITFNEITKTAVQKAIASAGRINNNLVDAQFARRALDRLVGYTLSPLLWDKVWRGLSAGRVQSVAVRLIVERERQIQAFVPHDYWIIGANVEKPVAERKPDEPSPFRIDLKQWNALESEMRLKLIPEIEAELDQWRESTGAGAKASVEDVYTKALGDFTKDDNGHYVLKSLDPKKDLKQKPFVDEVVSYLEDAQYRVNSVKTAARKDRPKAPFITSTLQRAASTWLGYGAKKTMGLAQRLYEGVDLGDGPVALITYMRTDSTRISDEALEATRKLIDRDYGPKYLPDEARVYKTKAKGAQEAHECVRPVNVEYTPDAIKKHFGFDGQGKTAKEKQDLWKLYDLVWKQFVACQMSDREYLQTTIEVAADRGLLRCSGQKETFDGYKRLWTGTSDADENGDGNGEGASTSDKGTQALPAVNEGDKLHLVEMLIDEKQTQPPPRYSEASLVKIMEAEGIGRPSTYAAIIDKIVSQNYVLLEKRAFYATGLGMKINDLLVGSFEREMDVKFTASIEEEFDKIENGEAKYEQTLREYWNEFRKDLEKAYEEMPSAKGENAQIAEGMKCPKCGSPMFEKYNKQGKFHGCTRYPDCDGTLDEDGNERKEAQDSGITCEKCGRSMLYRTPWRGGDMFLGCSGYPDCKNTRQLIPETETPLPIVEENCEKCGSAMRMRNGRRGQFLGCTNWPACRNSQPLTDELKAKYFNADGVTPKDEWIDGKRFFEAAANAPAEKSADEAGDGDEGEDAEVEEAVDATAE